MLWVKSFHIIFMVTWFAGLFYLPRLFVYHAEAHDEISNERFKVMERKLYYGIVTPSGILTVGFGIWLLYLMDWVPLQLLWMQVKIALVVLLIGYDLYCGRLVKDFKHDRNTRSHVWYRWFNEAPVIVLIAVILLVELQPAW